MKFTVLRPHQGDRWYDTGDEREARLTEVQHLVDRGVLAKAEPEVETKAEPKARNKAVQAEGNKAEK